MCVHVCFGFNCDTGQPELGSETGEWVTGEAVWNPERTAVFVNFRKDKNKKPEQEKSGES